MWLVDIVFALPLVLVAMAAVTATGTGLGPAMAVVGLLLSTRFARLARGLALAERDKPYIDAARVTGLPARTVLARYLLPNVAGPLVVQTAIIAAAVLLIGAALSFIGIGSAPDHYDWGAMLNQARSDFISAPWQVVPPAAAIVLTVLALNQLGDTASAAIGHGPSRPGPAVTAPRRSAPAAPGDKPASEQTVLSVRDLTVTVTAADGRDGAVTVVDKVSFDVARGEVLAVVGESGAGKSMTASAVLGLLPAGAHLTGGSVWFGGRDLAELSEPALRSVRGNEIGAIWQDPAAALNPTRTIGAHIAEPLVLHDRASRRQARDRAVELLGEVQLPDPARLARDYPHQLSGGMAQRAGIAAAIACGPGLLIADEPTTALDVTVQAQVLDLLTGLCDQTGTAMLLITHDLGVVAETADRVAVLYAGQVVETAPTGELFARPRHPYTRALLDAVPRSHPPGRSLPVIDGTVPVPGRWPDGCRFAPRCGFAAPECLTAAPALAPVGEDREARCARTDDIAAALEHPATGQAPTPNRTAT